MHYYLASALRLASASTLICLQNLKYPSNSLLKTTEYLQDTEVLVDILQTLCSSDKIKTAPKVKCLNIALRVFSRYGYYKGYYHNKVQRRTRRTILDYSISRDAATKKEDV